jgi:DNA-binding NtrC family response regulator
MVRVLIVDDDKEFVESLARALGGGFEIDRVYSFEGAERVFEPFKFDVVLLDIRLSEQPKNRQGLELLKKIKEQNPDLPVLIMTAYSDVDTAVESLKLGAEEFIQKGKVGIEEYRLIINNLFKTGRLKRRVSTLESRLKKLDPWEIVGKDSIIEDVKRLIKLVAEDGKTSVLIRGETGTGKELVARAIHREGVRKEGPYVAVALASLNTGTITSDLFGHEKGAFTSAISKRIGFIEEANNGVIFLDEIGELDPEVQVKLLRVLENGEFTRMGGNKPLKVDVQWVMATHRNLEELINAGKFREDLYYRLKVFEIHLPLLRERKGDIPLLVNHFITLFKEQGRTEVEGLSDSALRMLLNYDWPGNVRELRQVIEYSLLKAKLSEVGIIEVEHLPREINKEKETHGKEELKLPVDMNRKLAEVELSYIIKALEKTGKKTEAWRLLGYSNRFALRRRVLGIFTKYPELKDSFTLLNKLFTR